MLRVAEAIDSLRFEPLTTLLLVLPYPTEHDGGGNGYCESVCGGMD